VLERAAINRRERLDLRRLDIERLRGLHALWTVAASRFTAADNCKWWNTHDWSRLGEEWTPDESWRQAIIDRFLIPFVPMRGTVLEIGPGGGRWTEILRSRASRLYVLDIAEEPLRICQARFAEVRSIACLRGDGHSIPLRDESIDAIWSYDVFVHVNPVDAARYVADCSRVLRPGAHAVLHHPGSGSTTDRARQHRSDLTDGMIRTFAQTYGFNVVFQSRELVNDGDVLTVMQKVGNLAV
jgi:ubiquinone/menaquinone biosynthesis C-methylase UbiE